MADESTTAESTAKKKSNGKCDDGYVGVWIWCFKKTIIDKLPTPMDNVTIPDFTDLKCESALAALRAATKMLENLLAMPRKYANILKQLLNYPFNLAQNMINTALSAIDKVNKAINDLLSGTGLNELKKALEDMLGCSYLADSELGKLAASILDALKKGSDITKLLSQLKAALASAARDALNNLKKTPTKAINNLQKALENAMNQLGLNDLLKELKKLEKCVDSMCKAFSHLENFKNNLPTSSDSLLDSINSKWDSFSQKIVAIPGETASAIGNQALGAANQVSQLKDAVKFSNW